MRRQNSTSKHPFEAELLKKIPGKDRNDYWVAVLVKPLKWVSAGGEREIKNIIVTARWQRTQIGPGMRGLPVGIAYVTNDSVLSDSTLDFKKCAYVAIGVADES